MIVETLIIQNEKGLHARASALFVETVERFDASVTVSKDEVSVSGASIMGLLMLAAAKGSEINIEAVGPEACALRDALYALVNGNFGEKI